MKITTCITTFFLSLIISISLYAAPFTEMYVFGDSLSDTGNLASVTAPFPSPPTFGNRATNGIVAVEVLASSLGIPLNSSLHLIGPEQGSNYSFAGARAGGSGPGDLPTQMSLFLANHGGVAPAGALYIVFLGGNDIRDARSETDKSIAYNSIDSASSAMKEQVSILLTAGAKSIMIVNGPDIGSVPETKLLADELQRPELVKFSRKISKRFNRKLKKNIKKLEKEFEIDIIDFDLFSILNSVIRNSKAMSFTNPDNACFSFVNLTFYPGCGISDFPHYVFFDELHPTARTHERLGWALYSLVPEIL